MATIDLTTITNAPYVRRATVSTTWQEFSFPWWVTKASVICDSGASVYVSFIGAETPTDGGAVGSHYFPIGSGGSATVVMRDCDDNPTTSSVAKATSIFVASTSGSVSISLVLESGRD